MTRPVRRRPPRWSDERIEQHLRGFLADKDAWPEWRHWHRAGYGRAHHQALLAGGPHRWAGLLGVTYVRPAEVYETWSDARFRNELADFLSGRTTWPTQAQFRAAGRSRLYAVGARAWRREGLGTSPGLVLTSAGEYPT